MCHCSDCILTCTQNLIIDLPPLPKKTKKGAAKAKGRGKKKEIPVKTPKKQKKKQVGKVSSLCYTIHVFFINVTQYLYVHLHCTGSIITISDPPATTHPPQPLLFLYAPQQFLLLPWLLSLPQPQRLLSLPPQFPSLPPRILHLPS